MKNGREYFKASIDTTQFNKDAASMRNTLSDVSRKAEEEGTKVDAAIKRVGITIAGVFTVQKATQFVNDIAKVRGEFQQLEIAFETMLGSKAKADALMAELIDTAARTPFDLTGVANGAKQLLAYGTASEEVNGTLIRLGDVAAGLSIPLNDLVYLYGTTQVQGRLFTKDIHQFMGRGIPVVKELSKELGVSESAINEMVTAGKIGFPEIQKVFENLTNEGGMFFNLMEKQSASITGQIANLEDAYDVMLNDMGEKSQDVFTSAVSIATDLVENYETVGSVIGHIVAVYGTYKAAIIAVNVVQSMQTKIALQSALAGKSLTVVQGLQAVSARALSKAQARLNKTMLANPYVLATMALVGLGYALYKASKATTHLEDAQNRLKESNQETTQAQVEAIRRLNEYDIKLHKAKKGTEEYRKVKNDIVKQYGKYHSGLDEEIDKVGSLSTVYDTLSESIKKSISERQLESGYANEKQFLDKFMGENLDKAYDALIKKHGEIKGGELYKDFFDVAVRGKEMTREMAKGWSEATVGGLFGISTQNVTGLAIEIKNVKKASDEAFESMKAKYKLTQDDGEVEKIQTLEEQTKEARTAVDLLKQDIEDLLSGKTSSDDYAKDIEEKVKELKAAEEKLSYILTGKSSSEGGDKNDLEQRKKEAQDKADLAQKINNDEIKAAFDARESELDNQQKAIDILNDGFEKKQKQIELNHKKEILSIEQKAQELIIAKQQSERDIWESEGASGVFVAKTQTALDLPEQMKTDLVDRDSLANKKREKATDDLLNELLKKYQTYEENRNEIVKRYEAERVILEAKNKDGQLDGNIEELNKKEGEELAQLDTLMQDKTSIISRMFADMSESSIQELKLIREEAEALWEFLSNGQWDASKGLSLGVTKEQFENIIADPSKMSEFKNGIDNIKDSIYQLDKPINQIKEGFKELFDKDNKGTNKQIEALSKITQGYDKYANAVGLVSDTLSSLGDLTGSSILGSVADGLNDVIAVGNEAMDGAKTGAAFGPAGAIVGGVLGAFKGVTSILSANKKHREELKRQIEENQRIEYFGQLDVEAVWRSKYEWSKKIGESTLKHIKREGEELKKQSKENEKAQADLWAKLRNEQYKSGEHFKKTGLFGWGKGKIVEEWSSLGSKSWEQIEKLAFEGKLSEEGQRFYEALKKAKEEGKNLADMQEAYLEKLKEVYTGTTYENLVSSIVSAFKQGKRSAKDFAQSFEELMQGAVESSLQLLADENMRQWYEDFAKAGEDGYTKDEIEQAKKDWIRLNENLAEQAKQLEEVTGVKIGGTENQGSATYGAYEKITQEQASSIDGRLSGIFIETVSQNTKLSSIGENMHEMRNIALDSWGELISIRKNTALIKDTNDRLDKVIKNTAKL